MLVESLYRGHRIEVHAERVDGMWGAIVRIRRVLSEDKPHVARVTCRKVTGERAERLMLIWATRWVDLNGKEGGRDATG
jgi:hypothetical protein